MKTIIAGSREIVDFNCVLKAVADCGWTITEVVSGGARGVDTLGEQYAKSFNIPMKRFPADWNQHGRSAGVIRNREMANYAQALIAIWDGNSRGTKNMIDEASKKGLRVYVFMNS